jgi:hypothetical protein
MGASSTEIEAGVRRVTQPPGELAAAQVDAYIAGVQRSRAKWVRNTSGVTLQQWQNAMINKGIPRISQGAQQAQGKVEQFMRDFLPYVDQGVQQIKSMPKGGVDNGINRAAAMIRWNSNYERKPYTGAL